MKLFGHAGIKKRLQEYFGNDRLPSSYLFLGPAGVGKATAALWFAQLLNCEKTAPGENLEPCGVCLNCRRIENRLYPSLRLLIPPKQEIKIEQIRELIRDAQLMPLEGRYKVYIIKGGQSLTSSAANAFLKTLEEPPKKTIIILTAENTGRLLPTVLSRLVKLRFFQLKTEEIREFLESQLKLSGEELEFYLKFSGGSPGKALALYAQPQFLQFRQDIFQYLGELFTAQPADLVDYAQGLEREAEFSLKAYLSFFRDVLLVKEGLGEEKVENSDELKRVKQFASGLTRWQVYSILTRLQEGKKALVAYVNPRLAVHRTLIQLWEIVKGENKL